MASKVWRIAPEIPFGKYLFIYTFLADFVKRAASNEKFSLDAFSASGVLPHSPQNRTTPARFALPLVNGPELAALDNKVKFS